MNCLHFQLDMPKSRADVYEPPVAKIYIDDDCLLDCLQGGCDEVLPLAVEELYSALHQQAASGDAMIARTTQGAVYVHVSMDEEVVTWHDFFTDRGVDGKDGVIALPGIEFEKESYLEAVSSLQDWMIDGSLSLDYGSVETGYLSIYLTKGTCDKEIIFDECLSDPVPSLMGFAIDLRAGRFPRTIIADDSHVLLDLKAAPWREGNVLLRVKDQDGDVLVDVQTREAFAEEIDKIRFGLLYDTGFPHEYPCYDSHEDASFDQVDDACYALAEKHPDLDPEKLWRHELRQGKVALTEWGNEFYKQYFDMLAQNAVPEKWKDLFWPASHAQP